MPTIGERSEGRNASGLRLADVWKARRAGKNGFKRDWAVGGVTLEALRAGKERRSDKPL